jgi:hypothetical protein
MDTFAGRTEGNIRLGPGKLRVLHPEFVSEGERMKKDSSLSMVRKIMLEFADLTGLSSAEKAPRRYLWTDAFAVCNFLGLYRETGSEKYKNLALRLVDQVHNVLGRHREDDPRAGWISGLDEEGGKRHPTTGGLRIGKGLNERKPADPFDESLEWERDGQYYHYLTKWMHALNRVSRVTGDLTYNIWAMELAKTAHARFTYVPRSGGEKRMYWKMSIDLSYPLVPSMGHHDPLDGLITYSQLQATGAKDSGKSTPLDLRAEITDLAEICEGKSWVTDDPLGIGGLLGDAYKVVQLVRNGYFDPIDLLETLLDSSLPGLESYARKNSLRLPAEYRLAFRELGLSIGLRAVERLRGIIGEKPGIFNKKPPLLPRIEELMQYRSFSERIEIFWLEEANQKAGSWTEHRDINMVMLATSLAPDGYLAL